MASFDLDDMAEARAMANENGYHQRSPSMMIVVPLQDGDRLLCDDLNASFYEYDFYHGQEEFDDDFLATFDDDDEEDDDNPPVREIRIESPRGVGEQLIFDAPGGCKPEPPFKPKSHQRSSSSHARNSSRSTCGTGSTLPIITDLIYSATTVSAARRSCHRRHRNRALATTEFERNILPGLEDALDEFHLDGRNFATSNTNPEADAAGELRIETSADAKSAEC